MLTSIRLDTPVDPIGTATGLVESSDGRFAVYATQVPSGISLISRDAETGEQVTLSDNVVSHELGGYQFSKNNLLVFLEHEDDTYFPNAHLYAISPDGSGRIRLSESIVEGGGVAEFAISADGESVVYRADQDEDDVFELYRVPSAGGEVRKLTDRLVIGGDVLDIQIGADDTGVVFRVLQEKDDSRSLHSVPLHGGDSVKLNPGLVAGGNVIAYEISGDGRSVVYRADQETDGLIELFSVPITGGPTSKLNGILPGDVESFQFSPDSSHVVFRAVTEVEIVQDGYDGKYLTWIKSRGLFSVPAAGGEAVKLGPAGLSAGSLGPFHISADSSLVVFVAGGALHTAPLRGGQFTTITQSLIVQKLQVSKDDSSVAFLARRSGINGADLYHIPIDGGNVTQLSRINGQVGRSVRSFRFSDSGRHVIYSARQDADRVTELYSGAVGDGRITKLNTLLVDGGGVRAFQLARDGTHVIYRADQNIDDVFELYLVPVTGGTVQKISQFAPERNHFVWDFQVSPDGQTVAYETGNAIYSVPISGGQAVELVAINNHLIHFHISADSRYVVYHARQLGLYSVPLSGGDATQLSGPLSSTYHYKLSPDGSRAVYKSPSHQLFSVTLDNGLTTQLNRDGRVGSDFEFTPDGSRVIYRRTDTQSLNYRLYSVPLIGGESIELSEPTDGDGEISSFEISADSQLVVYHGRQTRQEERRLGVVSPTGGPVTHLAPASRNYEISDDGKWIAYTYDSGVYRLSVDDGTVTQIYAGTTNWCPSVGQLEFAGNDWIVFTLVDAYWLHEVMCDPGTEFGVYSAPISSGAATRLSDLSVRSMQITDEWVFFQATSLYRVPVSGGVEERVNDPLPDYGRVHSFQIRPDGRRVVYLADHVVSGDVEAFSVPTNGGDPIRLNDPLRYDHHIDDIAFTPDSQLAVYVVSQNFASAKALYVSAVEDTIVDLRVDRETTRESGEPVTVTAELKAPAAEPVTIELAFSGTAVHGADYTASSTEFLISAGSQEAGVTLFLTLDGLAESEEIVTVDIIAVENGHELGRQQATLTIVNGSVWTNPHDPLDVSGDGVLAPIDVLVAINELNQRSVVDELGQLPRTRTSSGEETSEYYYDVNGDGFGTSADVLAIINFLNRTPAGEGEFAAGIAFTSITQSAARCDSSQAGRRRCTPPLVEPQSEPQSPPALFGGLTPVAIDSIRQGGHAFTFSDWDHLPREDDLIELLAADKLTRVRHLAAANR